MADHVEVAQQTQFAWSGEAIQAAERATGDLLRDGTLMQRAATALTHRVAALVAERPRKGESAVRVVVLVGPGNNGGDALFAAAQLAELDVDVSVIQCAPRAHPGGLAAVRGAGVPVFDLHEPGLLTVILSADVVVDGILGLGARHRDRPDWQDLVEAIPPTATVVAVDCPTPGVRADLTVTFGAAKTSLLCSPEAAGRVEVVDTGLSPDELGPPEAYVYPPRLYATTYRAPGREDHKYTWGVVGFATGSEAYPGAAVLGVLGALGAGTGMVRYLGPERASDAVLSAAPEAVHGEGRVQAWVVGSGIDGTAESRAASERYRSAMAALGSDEAVVVDAGALLWLEPGVRPAGSATIVTPHAGELVGLLATYGVKADRASIEQEPVRWARQASEVTGYTVVLKGGITAIADPQQASVRVENRAPAWLATAGTGDVLAGVMGALLSSGMEPHEAGALAAYLHGQAAREANPGGPVRALDVAHQVSRSVATLLTLR